MEKDIFKLWLEYLRSGVYKINKFRMTNGSGRFSPIGVFADLLVKEYGEGRWANLDFDNNGEYNKGFSWLYRKYQMIENPTTKKPEREYEERAYNYFVYLPSGQWFWPSVTQEVQDKIYSLTDSQGFTLEDVADYLEQGRHLL